MRATLCATLLCTFPGCLVSTNDPTPATGSNSAGSLTIDWTINNSANPNQCYQSVATDIDIIVTTPSGTAMDEFTKPCIDGVSTIALNPGSYAANMALLDGAGTERTTWIELNPFTIYGGSELSISVDFPADSFK